MIDPVSEGVGLTLKEKRIERMVAGGRRPVRKVFCELYDKTGASGRSALLIWGLEHGGSSSKILPASCARHGGKDSPDRRSIPHKPL